MFTGEPSRGDLALDPPLAEPTGDHDSVEITQLSFSEQGADLFGLNPVDLDLDTVMDTAVVQRFDHREVGVDEGHVLADEPDAHGALHGQHAAVQRPPF